MRKKKCFKLILLVLMGLYLNLFLVLNPEFTPNLIRNENHDFYNKTKKNENEGIKNPPLASTEPNGNPLRVNQFANVSNIFTNIDSGENVSFAIAQDWISKNVNITFEGVSKKKDWAINGGFNTDMLGWYYIEKDTPNGFAHQYEDIKGNPEGSVLMIKVSLLITIANELAKKTITICVKQFWTKLDMNTKIKGFFFLS